VTCQPLRAGSNRREELENFFRFEVVWFRKQILRNVRRRYFGKYSDSISLVESAFHSIANLNIGPVENLVEKFILSMDARAGQIFSYDQS